MGKIILEFVVMGLFLTAITYWMPYVAFLLNH